MPVPIVPKAPEGINIQPAATIASAALTTTSPGFSEQKSFTVSITEFKSSLSSSIVKNSDR